MRATLKAVGTGILLAQMVFSLVTFNVAFATDYYVDAANGNNAWTGQSPTPVNPNGPKKNIYDASGSSALEIPGLTGGDTIHVAAGTYDAALGEVWPYDYASIGLPDGLRIRGADVATTILRGKRHLGIFKISGGPYTNATRIEALTIENTSGPGIKMTANNGETISPTIAGCTITDCTQSGIVGTWGAWTTTAVMHPVISACTVTDNDARGIVFSSGAPLIDLDVTIKNCTVTDNDSEGVAVRAVGTAAQAVLTVDPTTISGNEDDGVSFKLENGAGGTAILSGNTIRDNEGEGVYIKATLSASLDATIEGNTISNNSDPGINISLNDAAGGTCTISGNTIRDNEYHGVVLRVDNTSTLSATIGSVGNPNIISGNEGNGIDLQAIAFASMVATIEGNTVTDNDYDGMEMNASSTAALSLTVTGNTVSDNGYHGLVLDASDNAAIAGSLSSNVIEENGFDGMNIETRNGGSTASPLINSNTIRFNGFNGIWLQAVDAGDVCSPTIQSNTIQANGQNGISLSDSSGSATCNPDLGGGAMGSTGGNWITDNYGTDDGGATRYYDLNCLSYNPPTATVFARNNYWGVVDPSEIDDLIYDSNDQAGLSTVDYTPYMDSYTSVIPVSGWTKAYVVAAGTDTSASRWNGTIFDTAGTPPGSWMNLPIAVDGVLSTWDFYGPGNIYIAAKPLGNWNVIEYDAELFAGMWRSNGTYGPGGWAWFSETSFRAKGTEFVIPMSGWTKSKVYVASAKTPGVTAGAVEVYDAGGTLQTTENFTLPHFGALWKSSDLYALSGAKPCVARVTSDRDITVATGQYRLGSAAGWGDGVPPLAVGKGTDFVFPANGWSRCWFDVANVSGGPITGTVDVYDAGGTLQGTINIPNTPDMNHWRSAPNAIYALAKPAVVRITTTGEAVVRHARYTTSGDMAGWGYMVMPEATQEGTNFEFPVKGWGKAWVGVANSSAGPIDVTYTVYDASGAFQATSTVFGVPSNGYSRSWDALFGNIYTYASPAKMTVETTDNAVVTMNCWTSSGAKKAGWATGIIPNSVAP